VAEKQYAYYLEGNQVAIIEKDVNFDNDVDNKDYGPGASRLRWESPQSTVSSGLEIKYVYAPTYRVNDDSDTKAIASYGEVTGRLFFAFDSVTLSATAGDWILITGSGRWNGLHQVHATISSASSVVTTTKYSGTSGIADACTLSYDISVLQDEDFEFDLPLYLQKALVYYVKAKMAEDAGNLDLREYGMREFKKMIEKHESSRISGLRLTGVGPHGIR
tara:strand:- start:37 stop:693 length:657 start_codon:yes stop_codon:yes gene_type:complete